MSPLLATIYLNILDTLWKEKRMQEEFSARLIRYADDFVMLCRANTEVVRQKIIVVLTALGLSLNEKKTKTLGAREQSFNFLGFTVKLTRSTRTGRMFPLIIPSKKSMARARAEIKHLTREACVIVPIGEVIDKLNMMARGWSNYSYYGNSSKQLTHIRNYLENRVRKHLMRRKRKSGWGFNRYPYEYLYKELGLYKIPATAPWKTANSAG
ncbi:MAG TPA: group II intron maturase-specific domain-containing protein [Nitrospirota bacterium]|nr:group II intron maturase-specific domain-containing protein [Nitrospirota bacterium]